MKSTQPAGEVTICSDPQCDGLHLLSGPRVETVLLLQQSCQRPVLLCVLVCLCLLYEGLSVLLPESQRFGGLWVVSGHERPPSLQLSAGVGWLQSPAQTQLAARQQEGE